MTEIEEIEQYLNSISNLLFEGEKEWMIEKCKQVIKVSGTIGDISTWFNGYVEGKLYMSKYINKLLDTKYAEMTGGKI